MNDEYRLNPIEKTLVKTPETPYLDDDDTDSADDADIHLINEGAYGCIYYPGLNCKGNVENTQYLTKIQRQNSTTDNEWEISRRIRKKIPHYRNYFAPISKQCPVKIAKKYVKDIKQCQVFKDESNRDISTKSYVSNKIRYLGKTTLDDYFNQLIGQDNPIYVWKQMMRTHLRLLHGVHALYHAGILHMDIKSGNILIEPKQKHPILIDFGISVERKTMDPSEAFYVFDTYTPWCFEIFVCNYIVRKTPWREAPYTHVSKPDIDQLIHAFQYGTKSKGKTENHVFSTTVVPVQTLDTFRKNLRAYMSKFIGVSWKDVYDHLIQNTDATWDSYSVGVVFLRVLDIFSESEPERYYDITRDAIHKHYVQLLHDTVFVAPNKRLSIEETIRRIRVLWTSK